MKITSEKKPNCTTNLTVEIPAETVKEKRAEIVNEYAKYAKLPGFRPGKAPKAVVERRFENDINKAIMEDLLRKAYKEACTQESLDPISTEILKVEDTEDGGKKIEFAVTTKPEFELANYKGLKVEVQQIDVTDELVEKVLNRQREQFATLKDITDREARMGDFVVVDYAGKIDGAPLNELLPESEAFLGTNAGYLLKLESAAFLPGFCDQVAGAKVGDKKIVVAKLPENIASSVAGKDAVYEVTVTAVKEQELPELNDELAARMMPGKTLAEVKAIVRERLEADVKAKVEEQKRNGVVRALRDSVTMELPQPVVNRVAQTRVNQLVQSNLKRGVDKSVLLENENFIVDQATEQAAIDVKEQYLLLEVAKRENLKATRDEINLRIAAIAARNNLPESRVRKHLEKNDMLSDIDFSIVMEKTVNFLVENAEFTYVTVQPADEEAA